MSSQYDEIMGSPMDPGEHAATSVPQANQHYAGDVLPIPGELSMGPGQDSRAVDYALGKAKDPKVLPIGDKTLRGFHNRLTGSK
jgi:hypothetical protein